MVREEPKNAANMLYAPTLLVFGIISMDSAKIAS